MAASTAVQIGALVVAAGGTAASIQQSRKGQRAQEKADSVAKAQAELENKRSIRQAIAQGRVQRAQLISSGQSQTGSFGGSSAVTGALGSARTQLAANIGFANQTLGAQSGINTNLGRAGRNLSNAATFGQIAALPSQFGFRFAPQKKTPKGSAQGSFVRPQGQRFPEAGSLGLA